MRNFGPAEWGGWLSPPEKTGWKPGEETAQEYQAWLEGDDMGDVTYPAARTLMPVRRPTPITPRIETLPAGATPPGAQELAFPAIPGGVLGGLAIRGIGALLGGVEYSFDEAFRDFWGTGAAGREGSVGPGRTTEGTGIMAAGTLRAWDPLKQGYYGISKIQGQAYQGISFAPGNLVPGGSVITKAWATHVIRKDESMATTQFAMSADGRVHSLSETGVMKSWRPYKSIVIGKSLTTANLRRVRKKVKSHAKDLKKLLTILK